MRPLKAEREGKQEARENCPSGALKSRLLHRNLRILLSTQKVRLAREQTSSRKCGLFIAFYSHIAF